jgi:hypothetical protein
LKHNKVRGSKTGNAASGSIDTKRNLLRFPILYWSNKWYRCNKKSMVDPSNSTKNVVHFMLPKPAIIQIAEEVNNNGQAAASDGLMEFSLTPSTNATSSSSMSEMTNMAGT